MGALQQSAATAVECLGCPLFEFRVQGFGVHVIRELGRLRVQGLGIKIPSLGLTVRVSEGRVQLFNCQGYGLGDEALPA